MTADQFYELQEALFYLLFPILQWWLVGLVATGIFASIGTAWGSAIRGFMRL